MVSRRARRVTLLVATLVLGMLALTSPATAFPDVKPTDWFAGSLQSLVDAGIMDDNGQPFRPGDAVTRVELSSMIRRAVNPPASTEEPFTDVNPGDWFQESVATLFQAAIINGTTATTFSPNRVVDRQTGATLVVRALDYRLKQQPVEGVDILPADQVQPWTYSFRDRWMIGEVHKWGVANAYRLGLMDGDGAGWFYPFFEMNRAQAVSLIARSFVRPVTVRPQLPERVEAVASYPALREGSSGMLVSWMEKRLASIKYPVGPVDGIYDYRTTTGVMAFQKVEGLSRDGVFGAQAWGRVRSAQRPSPRYSKSGSRTEINLSKQVLFQIEGNQVVKIVPISSGAPGFGTPQGSFRIQRKILGWRQSRLGLLYSPSYFYGGYAIHGSRSVPPYPASHGCVRTPMWLSDGMYAELYIGRAVDIYK